MRLNDKIIYFCDDILKYPTEKLKRHKMKSKNDSISEKLLGDYGYDLSRLSEGIHYYGPTTAEANLAELKRISDLTSAFVERYDSIGIKVIISDINYILQRFDEWIIEDALFGNKDAEIFQYALWKKFEELEGDLDKIDEEFTA